MMCRWASDLHAHLSHRRAAKTSRSVGQACRMACSPLRMSDLINNFIATEHAERAQGIAIRIYDGDTQNGEALMYASDEDKAEASGPTSVAPVRSAGHRGRWWRSQWNSITAMGGYEASDTIDGRCVPDPALTLSPAQFLVRSNARVGDALRATAQADRSLARKRPCCAPIYDSSSVALFLVDPAGRITHANQCHVEMFLCPLDDLIAANTSSMSTPRKSERPCPADGGLYPGLAIDRFRASRYRRRRTAPISGACSTGGRCAASKATSMA